MKNENINNLTRVQKFIFENYQPEEKENAPEAKIENYFSICQCIYDTFYQEYVKGNIEALTKSKSELFCDWCMGLPGILDISIILIHDENSLYETLPKCIDPKEAEKIALAATFDELIEACRVYNFLQANNLEVIKK